MGAVSSGGASLTSMPGRLRWIEVATASRYILGETVTRTRTSFSYLGRQVTCVVPASPPANARELLRTPLTELFITSLLRTPVNRALGGFVYVFLGPRFGSPFEG